MSFALSWNPDELQAENFLLFDSVTSWNRSYSGTVSEHPIDSGGSVADHFISANPTFTLSAVISGVDISTTSALLADADGNEPSNTNLPPSAVVVESTDVMGDSYTRVAHTVNAMTASVSMSQNAAVALIEKMSTGWRLCVSIIAHTLLP